MNLLLPFGVENGNINRQYFILYDNYNYRKRFYFWRYILWVEKD